MDSVRDVQWFECLTKQNVDDRTWLKACPTSHCGATSVSVITHISVGMQQFTSLNWYGYQSIVSLWFPGGLGDFKDTTCYLLLHQQQWRRPVAANPRRQAIWRVAALESRSPLKMLLFFLFVFWEVVSRQRWNTFQPFTTFATFLRAKPQIFTRLPLNSVLLRAALQCQCKQQCTAQAAVPPASFKDKPVVSEELLGMELHRQCAYTVYLSALDSKSHNWLVFPYCQTSFCAVLHESQGLGFFLFL